ncbi:energy transducer TonB [Parerythrobacter aestuarii]|uniref:energy transducer TonB n=1 Tax=Parerythrobacter aestuarii TaxID=3020909 RepID=UPI0024DE8494|nr:energy transducer TonB [Parerythrobacter aestuarii]
MTALALRREEGLGLGVAVVLHLLLVVALLVQVRSAPVFEPVQKVTVSLAEEVGLQAEAPELVSESRAAIAPELAPLPEPAPEQPRVVSPQPRPTQAARPRPQPVTRPTSRPTPRPTATPRGSQIGADFLPGSGASTTTEETRLPASQIGASAKASIGQAIGRQIKPHWQPPSGPEVEKIVSYVRFRLNPDGSLAGRPVVVDQKGVNDINRAQAERHKELAIRAVQRAAPFDLPDEYYNAWKVVTADLDWRLSQ